MATHLTIDDISSNAEDLYFEREHRLLLEVWSQASESQKLTHPNVALSVADVHIYQGNLVEALVVLEDAFQTYKKKANRQGLALVSYAYSRVYHRQSRIKEAKRRIKAGLKYADTMDDMMQGEGNFLLGETLLNLDIPTAMRHYKTAFDYYKKVSPTSKRRNYNLAKVSLRLANISYMQMMGAGDLFHEEAKSLLEKLDMTLVEPHDILQLAHPMMQKGDLKGAWRHLASISQERVQSDAMVCRLHAVSAYIAWMADDDDAASAELALTKAIKHQDFHVLCLTLLARAFVALFKRNNEEVKRLIEESRVVAGDSELLEHRVRLIAAAAAAFNHKVSSSEMKSAVETLEFFQQGNLVLESAHMFFICAMMAKIRRRHDDAADLLEKCVDYCFRWGSINHIYRFYQVGYPYLAKEWDALQRVDEVNQALAVFNEAYAHGINGKKVRIYGFGAPECWGIDGKHFEGDLQMKHLLVLIERGKISRPDLLCLLYPDDAPDEALNKFSVMRTKLVKLVGNFAPHQKDTNTYTLKSDFPLWYDVHAFCDSIQQAKVYNNPTYKLVYYERAIDYYRGHFAKGLEGDYFRELRIFYGDKYHQLLLKAIELAEKEGRADLVAKWTKKLDDFLDNPPL